MPKHPAPAWLVPGARIAIVEQGNLRDSEPTAHRVVVVSRVLKTRAVMCDGSYLPLAPEDKDGTCHFWTGSSTSYCRKTTVYGPAENRAMIRMRMVFDQVRAWDMVRSLTMSLADTLRKEPTQKVRISSLVEHLSVTHRSAANQDAALLQFDVETATLAAEEEIIEAMDEEVVEGCPDCRRDTVSEVDGAVKCTNCGWRE